MVDQIGHRGSQKKAELLGSRTARMGAPKPPLPAQFGHSSDRNNSGAPVAYRCRSLAYRDPWQSATDFRFPTAVSEVAGRSIADTLH